ncbi:MAG: dTDP-4-dehydrorhamnose reductase [Candidatus Moraniibacteriota bacterium]
MENKRILILGSKGMLGQELVNVFSCDKQYTVIGWDMENINVTDFVVAEESIRAVAPEIIINAVAYNAVDKCEESEEEYTKAMILNAEAPKFLARLTKEMNAIFVHYSTDYVFDGERSDGYDENEKPKPLSRYGESKWRGEGNVLLADGKSYIVRLSKLFGKRGASGIAKKSFFDTMLGVAKTEEIVQVVDDEKSCFTYAPDLAQATKNLIESESSFGVYHLTNSGAVTWYEALQELYTQAKIGVTIQPVGSDVFPRKALRPKCSMLLNTKRPALRSYQEALREYLKNI